MLEYSCIYLNKQNSEYARILNVSDAVRHGRKVGPRPPGPLGPPVPQDPMDLQDLWTLEPQDRKTIGKLSLPLEIQNLNTQKL